MISFQYEKGFDELLFERVDKIYNMSKQIAFNNLIYNFKTENLPAINFIGFTGPLNTYKTQKMVIY